MKAHKPTDTREQILDTAERHFAAFGFAGTSLRGIIKDANVNVAAIAYHFGSKEDLFAAVVERFAAVVVAEQLRLLSTLDGTRDLGRVLDAFYSPPLTLLKAKGKSGQTLALFLGRMQTEPEPIFSTVDKHFAQCRNSFIEAFRRCSPKASEADLQWNFEFMLSLIVSFLTRQQHIRKRYSDERDWSAREASDRMIRFCLRGMQG